MTADADRVLLAYTDAAADERLRTHDLTNLSIASSSVFMTMRRWMPPLLSPRCR